jgi:HEAT repeat protein
VVQTGAAAALGVLARTAAGAGPATEALLEAARRGDKLNVEVRQTVALNLGHVEPNTLVVRQLAALCTDEGDQRTRCLAALALGRLARRAPDVTERARIALVTRWEEEPADVRAFLALGLGIGRCTAERSRLEHWLHDRGDPLHRAAAAMALGCMGEAGAHACLAKATAEGPPQFRGDAAEALGLLGTPESADTLRRLCDDVAASAAARAGAAYGLGLIGQAADRERLERVLADDSADARQGAVLGLGAFAGDAARDALLARAAGESMPGLRGLMVWAALLAVAERPLAGPGKAVQRSPWAREH